MARLEVVDCVPTVTIPTPASCALRKTSSKSSLKASKWTCVCVSKNFTSVFVIQTAQTSAKVASFVEVSKRQPSYHNRRESRNHTRDRRSVDRIHKRSRAQVRYTHMNQHPRDHHALHQPERSTQETIDEIQKRKTRNEPDGVFDQKI